jgi:hypothetical protein
MLKNLSQPISIEIRGGYNQSEYRGMTLKNAEETRAALGIGIKGGGDCIVKRPPF